MQGCVNRKIEQKKYTPNLYSIWKKNSKNDKFMLIV